MYIYPPLPLKVDKTRPGTDESEYHGGTVPGLLETTKNSMHCGSSTQIFAGAAPLPPTLEISAEYTVW